jgi:hypothetical protein
MACGGVDFPNGSLSGFSDSLPTVIITSEKAAHKSLTLRYLCVHQFLVDVVPGVDSLYHATRCGLKRSRLALPGNHGLQATGL